MEKLALLLVLPLIWPFVAKAIWKHEITLGELALNLAVGAIIVVAGWYGGKYGQMHDVEILNGQVTGKTSDRVSCEHSYRCNCSQSCTTDSKGNRSCHEVCQTCYDHPWDLDWNLRTTLGTIEVDRIDRRGLSEPSRWTKAQTGDPVAKTSAYSNYIKGAPDSLFNALKDLKAVEQFGPKVPEYPDRIHDLHYLNRVLSVGFALPEQSEWNLGLAMMLRRLGPEKEVNTVIVFANESNPEFATALRAKWLGGKKNDVVLVIGTPEYPKVAWARVVSWSDKELFKVELRDELMSMTSVDRTAVLALVEKHTRAGYVRKPMADFEYLSAEIEPPTWLIGLLFALSLVASVGISIWASRNMTSSRPFSFRTGSRRRFFS